MTPNRQIYESKSHMVTDVKGKYAPESFTQLAESLKADGIEYITMRCDRIELSYFKRETPEEAAARYSKQVEEETKKKMAEIQELKDLIDILQKEIEEMERR